MADRGDGVRMFACSDRLSAMETRVDSLAALVQCAIMRPTDSVDSLASDSSQATAVHSTTRFYLPLTDQLICHIHCQVSY